MKIIAYHVVLTLLSLFALGESNSTTISSDSTTAPSDSTTYVFTPTTNVFTPTTNVFTLTTGPASTTTTPQPVTDGGRDEAAARRFVDLLNISDVGEWGNYHTNLEISQPGRMEFDGPPPGSIRVEVDSIFGVSLNPHDTYRFPQFEIATTGNERLYTALWVGNSGRRFNEFRIATDITAPSRTPDFQPLITRINGSLSANGINGSYSAIIVYSFDEARTFVFGSLCDIFFAIEIGELWGSVPGNLDVEITERLNILHYNNTPQNVLIGYTSFTNRVRSSTTINSTTFRNRMEVIFTNITAANIRVPTVPREVCGREVLNAEQGLEKELESPFYPQSSVIDCWWSITSPPDLPVRIILADGVSASSLTVYDVIDEIIAVEGGSGNQFEGQRIVPIQNRFSVGYKLDQRRQSQTNEILLVYHNPKSASKPPFRLTYTAKNVIECLPQQLVDRATGNVFHFDYAELAVSQPSIERCPFTNRPMASVTCVRQSQRPSRQFGGFNIPDIPTPTEFLMEASSLVTDLPSDLVRQIAPEIPDFLINNFPGYIPIEGIFDSFSLLSVRCSVTIEQLAGITSSLPGIAPQPVLEDVAPVLEVLTSDPSVLSENDITTSVDLLSTLLPNTSKLVDEITLSHVLYTINHLAVAVNDRVAAIDRGILVPGSTPGTPTQNSTQTKSLLLSTLNSYVERVSFPPGINRVKLATPDISVQSVRVPPMRTKRQTGGETAYQDASFSLGAGRDTAAFVDIPSHSVAQVSQQSGNGEAVFYSTLLGRGSLLDSTRNVSQVLTVGARNVSSNFDITFDFNLLKVRDHDELMENPLKQNLNQARIVEWQFSTLNWIRGQCSNDSAFPYPRFTCKRPSSYAILFSSRVVPTDVALTVVSYVGCGLSILSLLATVIIYTYFKELRNKPTTPTLLNISLCLIAVYLLFAVGVGQSSDKSVCDAMTFLLHYATIASLTWMSLNAYHMLKAFTKVSYVIKANATTLYVIGYGLPFAIVMLNFGITVLYLDHEQDHTDITYESLYRARFACWLQPPSLYWGFLIPVGILLIFNYVVFVILLRKLTCQKKKIRSSAKQKTFRDHLINTVTMVTIMGLTWIFGYFLLVADDVTYQTVMQWLFTVSNVFLGVIIFILYCVRRQNVRTVWLRPRSSGKSAATSSGQSQTSSQNPTNPISAKTKATRL